MHDNYIRHNKKFTKEIFTFLLEICGELDELDLEELESKITEPYDPNEPFGDYVKSVEGIMETIDAAKFPCTTFQLLKKSFNLIVNQKHYY